MICFRLNSWVTWLTCITWTTWTTWTTLTTVATWTTWTTWTATFYFGPLVILIRIVIANIVKKNCKKYLNITKCGVFDGPL